MARCAVMQSKEGFWAGVGVGATAMAASIAAHRAWRACFTRADWLPSSPTCTTLSNGVRMPMIGVGTAFFNEDGVRVPEVAWRTVSAALEAGYTCIDTAHMYGTEPQVRDVVARNMMEGKLTRDRLFITTKVAHPPVKEYLDEKTRPWLCPTHVDGNKAESDAFEGVVAEVFACLEALSVGYIDLVLLHWPGLFPAPGRYEGDQKRPSVRIADRIRKGMWRGLEYVHGRKLARAIGLSNFTRAHLEALLPGCKVRPMVNQVEVHPYLPQEELIEYCEGKGIHVTAYGPLGSGLFNLMYDPVLIKLAKRRGISVSELVLTWHIQRGISVVPKSTQPAHLAANLRAGRFKLTPAEMKAVGGLSTRARFCPDPAQID